MSLATMIPEASIHDIGTWLDGLSPAARLEACRGVGRGLQRQLFEKAGASAPLTLDDYVPEGVDPLREVIHEGRNTLPAFRLFQKRFCRPANGGEVLFGYNEGDTRKLIGPGYFVMRSTAGAADEEALGSLVVDYTRVPDGPVADGWPGVVPNSQGLQRFVYHNTRDYMRRVSAHVTIGAAYKKGKALGAWFILCRQDPA